MGPPRVAGVARLAVVAVARPALVLAVHLRLPVLVAGQAGEGLVVRGRRVARSARAPFPPVRAGVDGEITPVMIEGRTQPRRRGVAAGAGRRERRRGLILVGR